MFPFVQTDFERAILFLHDRFSPVLACSIQALYRMNGLILFVLLSSSSLLISPYIICFRPYGNHVQSLNCLYASVWEKDEVQIVGVTVKILVLICGKKNNILPLCPCWYCLLFGVCIYISYQRQLNG